MTEKDFGVCRLSVVPIREEAGKGAQVSQLLFGDAYEVLDRSKDKQHLFIKTNYDEVNGWIDLNHHYSIALEYFEQITQSDYKISLDLVSTLLYKKSPLPIVLGSIVPISSSELFKMDEQFAFNGETKAISLKRDGDYIKTIATKYLNAPEVEGGKNPFGICSNGLVHIAFKIAGHQLPWAVKQQNEFCTEVDFVSIKTGDLGFFKSKKGNVNHVGIFVGDNKIIHAHGHVRIDHFDEKGIFNPDTKIYSHTLASVRRVLN